MRHHRHRLRPWRQDILRAASSPSRTMTPTSTRRSSRRPFRPWPQSRCRHRTWSLAARRRRTGHELRHQASTPQSTSDTGMGCTPAGSRRSLGRDVVSVLHRRYRRRPRRQDIISACCGPSRTVVAVNSWCSPSTRFHQVPASVSSGDKKGPEGPVVLMAVTSLPNYLTRCPVQRYSSPYLS